MCPFTYAAGVGVLSRVIVWSCVRLRRVQVFAFMVVLFATLFSYSGFCKIKYHPQSQTFQHPPFPPKSKVEMEPPQSCNTRAMKSTIHARRHGLRNRWSTLDLGGKGEANKLIVQRWYFISQ